MTAACSGRAFRRIVIPDGRETLPSRRPWAGGSDILESCARQPEMPQGLSVRELWRTFPVREDK
jgi:hypothetical protein